MTATKDDELVLVYDKSQRAYWAHRSRDKYWTRSDFMFTPQRDLATVYRRSEAVLAAWPANSFCRLVPARMTEMG